MLITCLCEELCSDGGGEVDQITWVLLFILSTWLYLVCIEHPGSIILLWQFIVGIIIVICILMLFKWLNRDTSLTVYIIVHVYRLTYHAIGDIDWCNSYDMNLKWFIDFDETYRIMRNTYLFDRFILYQLSNVDWSSRDK